MYIKSSLFLFAGIILSCVVYLPGLSGVYLLDDYINLSPLTTIQDSPQIEQVMMYLGSVTTHGLGRIISVLSFAAQYESWPVDPFAFKLVNLLIHIVNGILIYLLIAKSLQLSRVVENTTAVWLAAITAFIWLIHPLNVSSVLYVVQRMTELMTLFSLLALVGYVYGREIASTGKLKKAYVIMSLSVVIGGLCAVMSKENGVLILLYIAVMELTLFSGVERDRYWRIWALVFIATPLGILLAYFGFSYDKYFINGYIERDFTLYERWLTQFRVMLLYVYQILFTVPDAYGFFYDNYTASKGVLTPISTLYSMLLICSAVVLSFIYRKKYPLLAFGVLWFLAGHAMESTLLPLELVFEHRNYLPMLGILLAVVYFLLTLARKVDRASLAKVVYGIYILLALNLVFVSYQTTSLWGKPLLQAHIWYKNNPDSSRTAEHLGLMSIIANDVSTAEKVYRKTMLDRPESIYNYLRWIKLDCNKAEISLPSIEITQNRLKSADYDLSIVTLLSNLKYQVINNQCKTIDRDYFVRILEALVDNRNFRRMQARLFYLRAELEKAQGNVEQLLHYADRALENTKNPNIALNVTGWLVDLKQYDKALGYLDKAESFSRDRLSNVFFAASVPEWRNYILQLKSLELNQSSTER